MQAVTIQRFGGLDLRNDPGETSAAIDLLNVDLDQRGRVRTRNGLTSHASLSAGAPALIHAVGSRLYVIRGGQLDKVDSGTATNLGASELATIAELGTTTSSLVFFSQQGNTLKKYDGTTYGNSVGRPYFVATSPWDNRLIQARFDTGAGLVPTGSSATATDSTVVFSAAGTPETYGANDYLYMHPGGGEAIFGLVTWRDLVFVVKETRMFVFTGVSTGSTGSPIFNFRTVNLPSQIRGSQYAVTGGNDGVYLACQDGIYRTTGGVPVKISGQINPIFDGSASTAMAVSATSGSFKLKWALDRLYCAYTTQAATERWLVWDPTVDAWLIWSPTGTFAPPPASIAGVLYTAKNGAVLSFSSSATADDGTAIASHYQTGWSDHGSPYDKRVRELVAWGYGTPTISLFADRSSTDASAAAVTLGTAPAVARGVQHKSRTGREFSWKASAASGAWSLSSIELFIADQRVN